jgi:heme exporter protein A
MGFCLQEGALLLVKGANGSGKTSLLDILAGIGKPDEGRALWEGQDIAKHPYLVRDMMHIGHASHINEEWTVEKNIAAWGDEYDTQTLVRAALHYYDLEDCKDVLAKHLSAGLKRRLALSRLIVAPCKLWLLDEPTNFLDEEALLLTVSLIETRVKQGGIVIVATHIMNSAIDAHMLDMADFNPAGLRL